MIEEFEKRLLDKKSEKELENEIYNENMKPKLNIQMKEEFKQHQEEQLILLKENKQNIMDFLLDNKDSIRIEEFYDNKL